MQKFTSPKENSHMSRRHVCVLFLFSRRLKRKICAKPVYWTKVVHITSSSLYLYSTCISNNFVSPQSKLNRNLFKGN